MPDFNRMLKLNPMILARRIEALETTVERQFTLNDAAAQMILNLRQELAQKGAFIVALLEKLGGRFELAPADMRRLQESNLRVHYRYPDEKNDAFVMVLAAEQAKSPDEIRESVEAKLRATGMSEDEIAALRQQLDDAAAEAEHTFGEPPADAEVGVDPATPGDDRTSSGIVGPDGRPAVNLPPDAPSVVVDGRPPEGA